MLSEEAFNQQLAEEANRIAAGRAAFRALAHGVEVVCDGVRSHLDTRELYRAYAAGLDSPEPIAELARTLVSQSAGIAEVIGHAGDYEFARRHLYPQFVPEGMGPGRGVSRPWLPGLDITYVLDSDDWWQLVVVTEAMRRGWDVPEPRLFEVALENLAGALAAPTCVVPGRAYAFAGGPRPHLNAVQILLREQMEHLAFLCESDTLHVVVPYRAYAAVFVPGEEEPERRARRSLAPAAARHGYRVGDKTYAWRDGRWVGVVGEDAARED